MRMRSDMEQVEPLKAPSRTMSRRTEIWRNFQAEEIRLRLLISTKS